MWNSWVMSNEVRDYWAKHVHNTRSIVSSTCYFQQVFVSLWWSKQPTFCMINDGIFLWDNLSRNWIILAVTEHKNSNPTRCSCGVMEYKTLLIYKETTFFFFSQGENVQAISMLQARLKAEQDDTPLDNPDRMKILIQLACIYQSMARLAVSSVPGQVWCYDDVTVNAGCAACIIFQNIDLSFT